MSRSPLAVALLLAVASVPFSSRVAEAGRALGVDVSNNNGTFTSANWASAQASGIGFAFIKASDGFNSGDSSFASNVTGLRTTNILFGAYHFADPNIASPAHQTLAGAVMEADNFVAKGANAMKAGNLMPVLDYERQLASGSDTNIAGWLLAFSNEVYAKTGLLPTVYCNVSDAQILSSAGTAAQRTAIATQNLWLARYYDYSTTTALKESETNAGPALSNQYGPWTGTTNAQGPAKPWDFWQYSDQGSVNGLGTVDLDVANGDVGFVQKFKIPAIWQPDADGAWGTTTNWNTFSGTLPTATDRVIIDRAAANPLVTVAVNARVAQSLDLADQLAVTSGSLTIAEYANLNGATSVSGGALSAASIANASTLTVSGGTATSTGALTGAGTTSVTGGTLFAASITQASLAVAGTGLAKLTGVATNGKVNALSVASTATFDTGFARIVNDYTGASPIDAIRALALVGAITSSNKTSELGVGFIEATRLYASVPAGTLWNGVAIDGTSLLVQLALLGDTDLNGIVNSADLGVLAAAFNKPGAWQAGDFNYDGVVNAVDLGLLGANYLKSYTLGGSVTGGDPLAFAAAVAGFPTLVPEPTTLAAAGAAIVGLSRRRRVGRA